MDRIGREHDWRRAIRTLILTGLWIAPLLAVALWQRSPLLAIGLVFTSHMLVLYPTLRARSNWLGPVITRFDTTDREVWLTIDDGPTEDTAEILELLRRHDARATFFVKGSLAAVNAGDLKSIASAGHQEANHSQTHPSGSFWALPPSAVAREIEQGNRSIAAVTGEQPSLFRAPGGMKNPFVHPVLTRKAMQLVAWSARGFDGVDGFEPAATAGKILQDVRPGAILLMHQGVRGKDGRLISAQCIELVLEGLREQGYRCVIPAPHALR